jgi:outer membrane protein assembly factor BamB
VDGDNVVVSPGKETATVIALNKNTGAEVWRCAIPDGGVAAYGSTIVVDYGGIREYVGVLQNGMVGIDAHSGKLLWRYARAGKGSPAYIPTPVAKDGIIFTAGARVGSGAVKLKVVEGDKVSFEELYFDNKLPVAIGGSVVVGETLYGVGPGGLEAVDFATGNVKWQDKSVGPASLLFANGNLILHSEEGEVSLVSANTEKYEEKGRFKPKDAPARTGGAKTWAYPALANGQLYLHEGNSLWRYDLK